MRKSRMMALASATIAIQVVAPATAQDQAGNEFGGLETVVVSAQKRSEDVQRVPLTVMAFSEESLQEFNIETSKDLAQFVPGFNVFAIGGAAQAFIRGMGIQSAGPWQELSVSTYVDGVYYTGGSIAHVALPNIERVEVAKGPQGTLFGRNALGGVVAYVTKDPQQEPSLDIRLGYGNFDTRTGTLYATAGITPILAADIAVAAEKQSGGWGKNLFDGAANHTSESYAIRSKWVLTPGDLTKITLIGDYGFTDPPEPGNGSSRGVFPFIPIGPEHVGGFYDSYVPGRNYYETTQYGVSLKAEHDFGGIQFLSLSAARDEKSKQNSAYVMSYPYLPDTPAVGQISGNKPDAFGKSFNRTYTQELQLLSPDSAAIKWVGGVFLLWNRAGFDGKHNYLISGSGLADTLTYSEQKTESYSGFVQATAPIFESTRLTGGVRYTVDHRSVTGETYRNTATNPTYVFDPSRSSGANPVPSDTWGKPTYKLAVDHDFSDYILGYASYSTGFQSAYYTISSSTNGAPLQPQTLDAYEVGLKSTWFDNTLRINAAVFNYDMKNIVVSRVINGVQDTKNAAKSRIKGADVDIAWRPIEDLTLTAAIAYTDPKYTSFVGAIRLIPNDRGTWTPVQSDASGAQLQFTEKTMASATAKYVIPTISGDISLLAAATYHSGMHFDTQDLNVQPSYTLVRGAIGWSSPDETWDVRLWGENLTNKKYPSSMSANNTVMFYVPGEPRTYGIEVGYRWK